MNSCPWQEIPNFSSYDHYVDFKNWVTDLIKIGKAEEIEVVRRYSGSTLRKEHWYKHVSSGEVWQLVEPDPPFEGFFSPIPKSISNWYIQQFKSQLEYEMVLKWVTNQINLNEAEEIEQDNLIILNLEINKKTRYFKHRNSGEIWQLIEPSPPFYGSFWLINE